MIEEPLVDLSMDVLDPTTGKSEALKVSVTSTKFQLFLHGTV